MTALTNARAITAGAVARLRADRRLRIASVAAVALVVTAALVLWPSGPEGPALDDGKPAALRTRPDPVPAALGRTPADCGLSKETRADLVPGGEPMDKDDCWLYALDDGKTRCELCPSSSVSRERSLRVTRDDWFLGDVPVTSATQRLALTGPRPLQRIGGLGDEAFVHYRVSGRDGEAVVAFRFRNSDFRVTFDGWDSRGDGDGKPLPEKRATEGALRAAADVAKGVGAPVRPVQLPVLPPGSAVSPAQPPKVCELVPRKTLDKVAKGARRARGNREPLIDAYGTATDSCVWQAERSMSSDNLGWTLTRRLRVTVTAVPDRSPGSGAQAATLGYLRLHQSLRDGTGPNGRGGMKGFTALAGLGEQAFGGSSTFAVDAGEGTVVFRVRNMLVEVTYTGRTGPGATELLAQDRAVRGAYTAALAVAGSLHA